MNYIGIDNGSTGTIGVISIERNGNQVVRFAPTPTRDSLHYGKAGTITQRLDWGELTRFLDGINLIPSQTQIAVERPFSGKFVKAVVSAARFFEATLNYFEVHAPHIGLQVIDSRDWQQHVLGKVRGSAALKHASKLRGVQLYPSFAPQILKHKDADGLLIAHYLATRNHIIIPPHEHRQPQA